MLLRKIDGKINVKKSGFSREIEMEMVATCSMTSGSAITSVYIYAIETVVLQLTATPVATHPRRHILKR